MGIETILIITALAAAAISSYGAVQQANARRDAANFNAKIARNNALAENHQLNFDLQRLRDRRKRVLASNEAKLAKAGLRIDEGTADALQIDQENQLRLDEVARQYQGRNRIQYYKNQRAQFKAEASQQLPAARLAVAGSILGAAGSIAGARTNTGSGVPIE